MTTRHISHHLLSWLTAFLFILSANATAQTSNELPDSLVYSIEMYKEALNEYKAKKVANELKTPADSFLLMMSYYPWCSVFDSRSIHRVSTYDDGIYILKELVQSTNDTIQKQLYLDELMYVYDVWCEYADTINKQIDSPFSKTLILSEKVRTYESLMPATYNIWWDSIFVVNEDTLKTETVQANILSPEICQLYEYMKEALYCQDFQEDLYYEIPYLYFRLSHTRLSANPKLYSDQYTMDFDTVNTRYNYLSALNLDSRPRNNIAFRHKEVEKMYDKASGELITQTSGNWREKEEVFREQLYEKMDLWDFGLEEPDPEFLNRIIRGIGTDSSEVYVEAMERYIVLTATEETFANIQKYREKLAMAYVKKERIADAAKLYHQVAVDTKDDQRKKALSYYNAAKMYYKAGDYSNSIKCCRGAIKIEPNFGDAYYSLGLAISQSHWIAKWNDKKNQDYQVQDSYIQLLAIDKYELALQKIRDYANDPELKALNRTSEEKISDAIKITIPATPRKSDTFMFEAKFKEGGTLIILNEQVKVRFYNE